MGDYSWVHGRAILEWGTTRAFRDARFWQSYVAEILLQAGSQHDGIARATHNFDFSSLQGVRSCASILHTISTKTMRPACLTESLLLVFDVADFYHLLFLRGWDEETLPHS